MNRTSTEKFRTPTRTRDQRKTVVFKDSEDGNEIMILGVPIPNLLDFRGFSICSNPIFLYKIAKIANDYGICLHDGLCSIKEYLELLRFERDAMFREKQRMKALALQEKLLSRTEV